MANQQDSIPNPNFSDEELAHLTDSEREQLTGLDALAKEDADLIDAVLDANEDPADDATTELAETAEDNGTNELEPQPADKADEPEDSAPPDEPATKAVIAPPAEIDGNFNEDAVRQIDQMMAPVQSAAQDGDALEARGQAIIGEMGLIEKQFDDGELDAEGKRSALNVLRIEQRGIDRQLDQIEGVNAQTARQATLVYNTFVKQAKQQSGIDYENPIFNAALKAAMQKQTGVTSFSDLYISAHKEVLNALGVKPTKAPAAKAVDTKLANAASAAKAAKAALPPNIGSLPRSTRAGEADNSATPFSRSKGMDSEKAWLGMTAEQQADALKL